MQYVALWPNVHDTVNCQIFSWFVFHLWQKFRFSQLYWQQNWVLGLFVLPNKTVPAWISVMRVKDPTQKILNPRNTAKWWGKRLLDTAAPSTGPSWCSSVTSCTLCPRQSWRPFRSWWPRRPPLTPTGSIDPSRTSVILQLFFSCVSLQDLPGEDEGLPV